MAKIVVSLYLLLNPYKENENIVICRVDEKEIEQAFAELVQFKIQL